MKYLVNCEIVSINDTDDKGNLALKPVVEKLTFAQAFDTEAEVRDFLAGDLLPVRRVS